MVKNVVIEDSGSEGVTVHADISPPTDIFNI